MRERRGKRDRDAPPARPAYEVALGLLARREQSRHELRARLLRDGHPAEEVDAALTRLGEAHYQDDARFAGMLVRARIRQGYGPQRLRTELKSHDLADAQIRALLEAEDIDWEAVAREQLRRHYGNTPAGDYRERAKRMQFLARRGFDADTARASASEATTAT